jgi:hypothetical protein
MLPFDAFDKVGHFGQPLTMLPVMACSVVERAIEDAPHRGASFFFECRKCALSPYFLGDSAWFIFLD